MVSDARQDPSQRLRVGLLCPGALIAARHVQVGGAGVLLARRRVTFRSP